MSAPIVVAMAAFTLVVWIAWIAVLATRLQTRWSRQSDGPAPAMSLRTHLGNTFPQVMTTVLGGTAVLAVASSGPDAQITGGRMDDMLLWILLGAIGTAVLCWATYLIFLTSSTPAVTVTVERHVDGGEVRP